MSCVNVAVFTELGSVSCVNVAVFTELVPLPLNYVNLAVICSTHSSGLIILIVGKNRVNLRTHNAIKVAWSDKFNYIFFNPFDSIYTKLRYWCIN